MKRFTFVTGTVPETEGYGVQWPDGRVAYREVVASVLGGVVTGHVDDIDHQYGGQAGYRFKWVDE